jgi:hypothetical protein
MIHATRVPTLSSPARRRSGMSPDTQIQCANSSCGTYQISAQHIRINPRSRLTLAQLERANVFNGIIIGLFYTASIVLTTVDIAIIYNVFSVGKTVRYWSIISIFLMSVLLVYSFWKYFTYTKSQLDVMLYTCKRCGFKWSPNYRIEPSRV